METKTVIEERIAQWHKRYRDSVSNYYVGNLSCEELCELEGLYLHEVSKLRLQLNELVLQCT